ncbi:hypothetical protein F5878DRAFT_632775 [Lentinula raphanica]|uniref:Uncharacterized protein n=1 Tax=Lentinula raphanica TaxID=153919 RepID=A0AA38NZB7_9AGAR|nr:hypothetical protein F5878DRAFT_632775 [Lentinula raphanica]
MLLFRYRHFRHCQSCFVHQANLFEDSFQSIISLCLFSAIFPSSVGFSQLSFWRCGRWLAFLHLSFSIIIVSYSFTTSTLIELFFI